MPSRPSRTSLVDYRAYSCRDLLSALCTRPCTWSLPNKFPLALPFTRVENIPLTSHARKCWEQEKDKVSLVHKTSVTKFYCNRLRSPDRGTPASSIPVSVWTVQQCAEGEQGKDCFYPFLVSRQMNQRCVLSVFYNTTLSAWHHIRICYVIFYSNLILYQLLIFCGLSALHSSSVCRAVNEFSVKDSFHHICFPCQPLMQFTLL